MDIVNIKKADAIKAHKNGNSNEKQLLENLFGKELFSQKLEDRIKTMDDVYDELELHKHTFEKSFIFFEDLDAAKVRLIVKVFNEGWQPDWTDSNQTKYTPYFESENGVGFSSSHYYGWVTSATVGSRLCFKSRELALNITKRFQAEFEAHYLIK